MPAGGRPMCEAEAGGRAPVPGLGRHSCLLGYVRGGGVEAQSEGSRRHFETCGLTLDGRAVWNIEGEKRS